MPRASHRIVGVVELQPSDRITPCDFLTEYPPPFDNSDPAVAGSCLSLGQRVPQRQVVLADVGRLQCDLGVELNRFLATA